MYSLQCPLLRGSVEGSNTEFAFYTIYESMKSYYATPSGTGSGQNSVIHNEIRNGISRNNVCHMVKKQSTETL